MRIGHGYDVHRLESGRRLILGGVQIPYPQGLAGHSDADVLTHAVMDALFGAAGLGDIGMHFPDTDDRFSGIDSLILARETVALVQDAGYCICKYKILRRCYFDVFLPAVNHRHGKAASLCQHTVIRCCNSTFLGCIRARTI